MYTCSKSGPLDLFKTLQLTKLRWKKKEWATDTISFPEPAILGKEREALG